jgi:hypothetical protein
MVEVATQRLKISAMSDLTLFYDIVGLNPAALNTALRPTPTYGSWAVQLWPKDGIASVITIQ